MTKLSILDKQICAKLFKKEETRERNGCKYSG
jgi:hypothetical protein